MQNQSMSRKTIAIIVSAGLLLGSLIAIQAKSLASNPDGVSEDGISILHSDHKGLHFYLNTNDIQISETGVEYSNLTMLTQQVGAPQLPYFSTFIAVPPEAEVIVNTTQLDIKNISGISVPAGSEPTLSFSNSDPDSPFPIIDNSVPGKNQAQAANFYAKNALYPEKFFQVSAPIYYRDMRLVKLDLFPVQFNPVKKEIQLSQKLDVTIEFKNAQLENLQPAPTPNDVFQSSVAGMILNFEQGKVWRSLPLSSQEITANRQEETAVSLPIGSPTYKIEINQDGIYDILGSDLAAAGLTINSIDPDQIEIMSRGEPVAYQFIKMGTNPNILESSDIIRFYGEGVNGSRREKQFLTHNIYWLWPNGSRTPINTVDNAPGAEDVTTFTDTKTREDENVIFSTWTNKWDQFPNEPDSYYWKRIISPASETFTTTLLSPVLNSPQSAQYTVEFISRDSQDMFNHQVEICLNAPSECKQQTWTGQQNVNVSKTVPMSAFVDGVNEFTIDLANSTNPTGTVGVFLNRISVTYPRYLEAIGDQLFFHDSVGGRAMNVQSFTEATPSNVLAWDITDPNNPVQILLDENDKSGTAGNYTYTIGINGNSGQKYLATTTNNTLTPATISQYTTPTNLEPENGADWVAISYGSFIPEAAILANHRQQNEYGGLKTHIVDIEDVVNIYGYGMPMPEAIHAYLKNALETWSIKPSYVVLVGDGVTSPRFYKDLNFVPTDMQFKDRFQGLIPSDNTMVFLVGDDLLPDMAIGRLPVESSDQATTLIAKIIQYEQNLQNRVPGYKRVLFMADLPDPPPAGSFCETNQTKTGPLLPTDYEQIHLCRENFPLPDETTDPFLDAMTEALSTGVSLMNYRGHGSIQWWGKNPGFWNTGSATDQELESRWNNNGHPVILLSADCLDGYFAWQNFPALSERFLKLGNGAGSAAHWSSAGLGYDHEHTTLLEGFYTSIFEQNKIPLGDAVNYAKLYFRLSSSYAESEMYTFNLQGDPAMLTILFESDVYLPIVVK